MNNPDDPNALTFLILLTSFGLVQHVRGPTHQSGHTLDLVITRSDNALIWSTVAYDQCISDHYPVCATLVTPKALNPTREVSYRRIKAIDKEQLDRFIEASSLSSPSENASLEDNVTNYQQILTGILDVVAPLRSSTVRIRVNADWYNDEIRAEKQRRRQAERRWRKSKLPADRELFIVAKNRTQSMIDEAKSLHYREKVSACSDDPKKLFRVVDTLLGNSTESPLPVHDSRIELATRFSDFFIEKIVTIQSAIPSVDNPPRLQAPPLQSQLAAFQPLDAADICALISGAAPKSCELDPLPSPLVKDLLSLRPIISRIVNQSLATGAFPTEYKSAVVRPLLKKPSLDRDSLKNYRPVSNLSFVSKLIERAVASQLASHLRDNDLMEPRQSAYRPGHSTETALLSIHNEIVCALGDGKAVLLVLLDLSAAFDTVHHPTMLSTLESLGVTGTPLKWFESYLSDRSQAVQVGDAKSDPAALDCGVPQGSVLGPILFTMYTSSLGALLREQDVSYHLYADDSQLLLTCDPRDPFPAIARMEACIHAVQAWMGCHSLKMNGDKTEILLITSKPMRKALPDIQLCIDGHNVQPSTSAKNLGVTFDHHASMERHITSVCRLSYMQLRRLRRIKKLLPRDVLEALVHAFVTSRLDYCNSLYLGIPQNQLERLQRIQNCAARLVTDSGAREHITPVLQTLHWLPVKQRVLFKVLLIVFKSMHNLTPQYLSKLINVHVPSRRLRSSNQNFLTIPFTRSSFIKKCAFSVAGPTLFNTLPINIRQAESVSIFKQLLKTYLFHSYYFA